MKDEGRATGGLDPDHDRPRQPRLRWGRRSPYGYPRYDRGQGETGHAGPTYAALDLGTNNCRLLVARPTGDSFRVIDAFSRIIRLGEDVDHTKAVPWARARSRQLLVPKSSAA